MFKKLQDELANKMAQFDIAPPHRPDRPAPTVPVGQAPAPVPNTATKPSSYGGGSGGGQAHFTTGGGEIKFWNLSSGETVSQRITIVIGETRNKCDGSIIVHHHLGTFPSQRWPVNDGWFRALVHLEPGPNRLQFVLESERGAPVTGLELEYMPLLQNPPVHLCLMVAADSPLTFDSPDYKRNKEGNTLDVAIKKLRMAGYMMSAYTQEQMRRNGLGNRTFRVAEEWTKDTISNRDKDMRQTAKIHIIRMKQTRAEILDPDKAQQHHGAKDAQGLFNMAFENLFNYGGPFQKDGPTVHAACIYLDTHWDPKMQLIRGHAALGGGNFNIRLAVFGGHALYSWPTCIEDVVPCFYDDTRTDTRQVADDSGQSGTAWENLNVGMGAFLHEIGHLLGCPHQENGIMMRDYIIWNRSFMTREAFKANENKPGMRLVRPQDECTWHRLDLVRFRFHPSFRLPNEERWIDMSNPLVCPLEDGAVVVKAESGIYLVDVRVGDWSRGRLEFIDHPQREVVLRPDDLRASLPREWQDRSKKMRVEFHARGERSTTVDDFDAVVNEGIVNGDPRVRMSARVGNPGEGDVRTLLVPDGDIAAVRFYHGSAVDGVEFVMAHGQSVVFGEAKGKPTEVRFEPGEVLLGFFSKSGYYVDSMAAITNRRRYPSYGGSGGGPTELLPPHGYRFRGLTGSFRPWLFSVGVVYSR